MKELEFLDQLRTQVDSELRNIPSSEQLPLFYEPINYINTLPGKKIRPLLTLVCGLSFGGNLDNLIKPAAAIELLHNFSLVHDDIMDQDEVRRGQPTVHVKWDLGTAILAGDGLLGLAYRKLLKTGNISGTILAERFTDAMLDICEGQALDKMFETQTLVSEEDYIEMIGKKTAVLISLSCEFGAIVGGGSDEQIKSLAELGYSIGMGFQIQDDLLDILADEQVLGKKVGSDLEMNKKTIVSIKLQEKTRKFTGSIESVEEYQKLIQQENIIPDLEQMVNTYFKTADENLKKMPENEYKELLKYLINYIRQRNK
jgi:geranylgeranyl pyrophosphate synthase